MLKRKKNPMGGMYQHGFTPLLRHLSGQQSFGHVAEIGVHYGESFLPLAQCRRPGEIALAVDCFEMQEANISRSGKGNSDRFKEHTKSLPDVLTVVGDSRDFTAADYLDRLTRKAYPGMTQHRVRLFHVDGGHDYDTCLHDLTQAWQCLTEDGILIVDDFLNHEWPEVTVAVLDFLRSSARAPGAKLLASGFAKAIISQRTFDLPPAWRQAMLFGRNVSVYRP